MNLKTVEQIPYLLESLKDLGKFIEKPSKRLYKILMEIKVFLN